LTGKDLMDAFGLGPGPHIGTLLNRARTICETSQCSREELLDRLRIEALPNLPGTHS